MTLRRLAAVFALAVFASPGTASAATHTTTNFVVEAPDEQLARRFGEKAEEYRREKALDWLGREMPPWPKRCPLQVSINGGGAGGATTFTFGSDANGRSTVTSRRMEIRGDVRQLLYSVLPHEVTHTVLAEHFGRPVPRWADEGGSVLSENEEERFSHDIRNRELLNSGRGIRLRVLFRMTEYPKDMIVLYAQGYSITAFLVERGGGGREGRAKLLQFLGTGMGGNTSDSWNEAAKRVYGFDTADALEEAWLTDLKTPPSRTAARNAGGVRPPAGELTSASAGRTDIRNSAAPMAPVLEPPVKARGAAPSYEPVNTTPAPASKPASAPDRPVPVLLPPEIPKPAKQ